MLHTKLVAILLCLGLGCANAENSTADFLTGRVAKLLIQYEKTQELCESAAVNHATIHLPIDELRKAGITRQELQAAILFFRNETLKSCTEHSRLTLMAAILDLQTYTASDPNAHIDPIQSGLALLSSSLVDLEAAATVGNLHEAKGTLLRSVFEGKRPSLTNISNWQQAIKTLVDQPIHLN